MLIICGIGRKTPWKLCLRGFLSQRTSTPRNPLRLKYIYKFHHEKPMICGHTLSLPDCRKRLITKESKFFPSQVEILDTNLVQMVEKISIEPQ